MTHKYKRLPPPELPEKLMTPVQAVCVLREFDGSMFKRALRWEIAVVIEDLMKKAGCAPAPALVAMKNPP